MLELVARRLKSLENPKLDVIEASDGEEAWRLAQEHLPDLVVLDVMMPGMSGWEVCRKIREEVSLAHTGVVMLTGIGENLNQMTSPLYGADAYIDKPFDFGELDVKVKEALQIRAVQREAVARPSRNGVGGPARAAVSSAGNVPDEGQANRQKRGSNAAVKGKKMAAKKTSAAKKPAAKKAAVNKPAAKKSPAVKKPVAKRAAVAKRPATKRAATKRAAAKIAPKRVAAARKPAAKKAATRRPAAAPKKPAKRTTARRATPKKPPAR